MSLVIDGLADLKQALLNLPKELQAEAGHVDREIGFGAKSDRNNRAHKFIDPIDEPPSQTDSDV